MAQSRSTLILLACGAGLLASAGLNLAGAAGGQPIVYVDQDASGPVHDGTSWCQAYLSLSEAIDAAVEGDTVRVADGIYKPDPAGLEDPRDATFELISGVRIEGGYAGCGAVDPDARDTVLFETILNGDLYGDDVPPADTDCFVNHETLGCDNEACEAMVCDA